MPEQVSAESRFIGYLVLGFGVLAVIAVLILAFGGSDDDAQRGKSAKTPPASAKDLMADLSQPPKTMSAPAARTDLFFEREKDFDSGDMEGDWQASIGRYTAVLQIRKNVYQLILAGDDPVAPRMFSSGTFKVVEDIIMLTPRLDWPPPAQAKGRFVAYDRLTRAPFPVIARFDGGKMLWQNVPQEETRVIAPYTSPVFLSENIKVAVWKKM